VYWQMFSEEILALFGETFEALLQERGNVYWALELANTLQSAPDPWRDLGLSLQKALVAKNPRLRNCK